MVAPTIKTVPALPARAVADPMEALRVAGELARPAGVVCVAGSIFLVGEVRDRLPVRFPPRLSDPA